MVAERIPVEVRQAVLPDLKRVDRCTTCHIAVEDPSYGGYPQPLSYHPLHEQHPFEKFGCTICHRGQGRATTTVEAHGNVPHWDEPMLPMEYIQASCGQCHEAADNPAAPELAQGEQVFENSGCRGCHKLGGTGGIIGPELDKVGRAPFAGMAEETFHRPRQRHSRLRHAAAKIFGDKPGSHRALHAQPDRRIGRRLLLLHESSPQYPRRAASVPNPEAASAATPSTARAAKWARPWTMLASVALRNG
jgi:hypothetical protein